MKVHEKRSHTHTSGNAERPITRKQKAEAETSHSPKKSKTENEGKGKEELEPENGKSTEDIKAEFERFCKAASEHLSIQQMREILEANGQDSSGSDDAVVPRCQDMLFYGPSDKCPVCDSVLQVTKSSCHCTGSYSEWSTCTFTTTEPPRKNEPVKLPDSVNDPAVVDWLRKYKNTEDRAKRTMKTNDKPFKGLTISLSGRLTRKHQFWKTNIEKNGGKVSNSVNGVTCLVVSPAERDRVGSSKIAEAMERNIPVVREAWLRDSIDKNIAQPLGAYEVVSDLTTAGGGIPLYQQDVSEEALETISAELKVYGKRGVHKDTKLQNEGGEILKRDGILYNCAFSVSDRGRGINEFCVMQLISVPENRLYMYYKRGKIGDDAGLEERLDEWENIDSAIKEFAKSFEGLTGNKFETWEREKKIQKQPQMFYPIDIDDGVEVRHGGLGLRQLGVAVAHCMLEPRVANFMKVLCSQEIYRYALMEMGLDLPDLPLGMVTDLHIKRCEETFLEFIEKLKSQNETGQKRMALWSDLSQRIFTLLPSTRPYVFSDYHDVADNAAAAIETVRDICVASRTIGDMSGSTLDDPLFDRYKKLGCTISAVEKDDEDYKMIVKYLETTYEPVKVEEISYGVSVESIYAIESSACPSLNEIKKLPNKHLLWCGTRSSNLLRHLQKGFLPAICSIPVPGYMFGRAIVCSDASAEAARYGFTAVDRPEGFLVLAVASLGEKITEVTSPPEDTSSLERKKFGVIGRGKKKTDESEHFMWKDDVKVPCGRLIPSEHKDSYLEYNEYAVYDPKQVSIRFLVGVKFEGKDVEYDTAE